MMSISNLGPFKVDSSGYLCPATPALFPRFCVNWRRRAVQARMLQPDPGNARHGTLEITTRIGRVPSTGKGLADPGKRDFALGLLRDLPKLLPPGWKLRLAPDHSVVMESRAVLVLPISAISLVTEISMFLLALNPYLDALDESGAGSAAGMANT